MRILGVLAVLGTVCGCHLHLVGEAPPPPPQHHRQTQSSGLRGQVSAKEIKADVVRARVIHCKELKAGSGSVAAVHRRHDERKGGWGEKELRAREVSADTIYAKEIKAGHVEAQEVYCKEVKIGGGGRD